MSAATFLGTGRVRGPDFEIDIGDEPAGTARIAVLAQLADGRMQKLGRAPGGTGGVLRVRTPAHLVASVRLRFHDAAGTELAQGTVAGLADLLPRAPAGVLPAFFQRANRPADQETLFFICRQMLADPEADVYVRLETVKVLAYAALEGGDDAAVADALAHLATVDAAVAGLPPAKGSSKLSPVHVEVSLGFIRFQLHLLRADWERAAGTAQALLARVPLVAAVPIIAFNLGQALLLQGWALAFAGRLDEAGEVLQQVVASFRAAAGTMPAAKSKLFSELEASLRAASHAVGLLSDLRQRPPQRPPVAEAVPMAARFSRLTQPAAHRRLGEALLAYAAVLATAPARVPAAAGADVDGAAEDDAGVADVAAAGTAAADAPEALAA